MYYQSTRGSGNKIISAEAIAKGLSEDGGLYVPEAFPVLSQSVIKELAGKPYEERAAYIMGLYLTDFSADELSLYAKEAYSANKFHQSAGEAEPRSLHENLVDKHPAMDKPPGGRRLKNCSSVAPVSKLESGTYFLELWHGPTCAFKDMALQVMPRLLTASLRKLKENREVCVLVATSGDTGKAALEGFSDVPGTKIMVFYPHEGVSRVQELQMTSQSGGNVNVVAVKGNFDDAQTGVKMIFSDESLRSLLSEKGVFLSSANSINWGRLVPQISYYFSAYCDLLAEGEIGCGDKVNFCIPTGNFGNILAAYYALRMGLPVNKLICASNRNDVLTQFLSSGTYDKNRPFHTTASPSMDILVSSNLERLLYELSGKNGSAVCGYMAALSNKGRYEVPSEVLLEAKRVFASGRCGEDETMEAIAGTFNKHKYLMDTHTAVAYKVLCDYRSASGDNTPTVVVSTASPYKFCGSVLKALGKPQAADSIELIDILAEMTENAIPAPLSNLRDKKPRFEDIVPVSEMKAAVLEFLS